MAKYFLQNEKFQEEAFKKEKPEFAKLLEEKTKEDKELLNKADFDPVFKKAMSNYNAGQVLGFVGGFMVGWPLGTALGGGDPNWGIAAGGVAVLLCTIPLSSAFKKHARTAVDMYNGKPMAFRPTFHVSPYGAGAKVIMKF